MYPLNRKNTRALFLRVYYKLWINLKQFFSVSIVIREEFQIKISYLDHCCFEFWFADRSLLPPILAQWTFNIFTKVLFALVIYIKLSPSVIRAMLQIIVSIYPVKEINFIFYFWALTTYALNRSSKNKSSH